MPTLTDGRKKVRLPNIGYTLCGRNCWYKSNYI